MTCDRCHAHELLLITMTPERVAELVRAFVREHEHGRVAITTPPPTFIATQKGSRPACSWCGKKCKRALRDEDGDPTCPSCARAA